jgi:hypothetical protein
LSETKRMGGGKRECRTLIVLLSYNPAGALLAFTSSPPAPCLSALLPEFSPHYLLLPSSPLPPLLSHLSPHPTSPSTLPLQNPLSPPPQLVCVDSYQSLPSCLSHLPHLAVRLCPCPLVPSIRTNPPVYGRTAYPSFPNRSIRWGLLRNSPRTSPVVYAPAFPALFSRLPSPTRHVDVTVASCLPLHSPSTAPLSSQLLRDTQPVTPTPY